MWGYGQVVGSTVSRTQWFLLIATVVPLILTLYSSLGVYCPSLTPRLSHLVPAIGTTVIQIYQYLHMWVPLELMFYHYIINISLQAGCYTMKCVSVCDTLWVASHILLFSNSY